MSRVGVFGLAAVALTAFAGLAYRTYRRRSAKAAAAATTAAATATAPAAKPSGAALTETERWALWRSADAVCFDVDSTVTVDEGIDELAGHFGCGEAVAAYTANAMNGAAPFEDALRARLELIRPTTSGLAAMLSARPPRLTPGIAALVRALHARGTAVFLVSGGFRQLIAPVAAALGLAADHVTANSILFTAEGTYRGFDDRELTCRNGGKARAVAHIIRHGKAHVAATDTTADTAAADAAATATATAAAPASAAASAGVFRCVVMIGDGITDVEARPPASLMIGFGGIRARPAVQAAADLFVTDFDTLRNALA